MLGRQIEQRRSKLASRSAPSRFVSRRRIASRPSCSSCASRRSGIGLGSLGAGVGIGNEGSASGNLTTISGNVSSSGGDIFIDQTPGVRNSQLTITGALNADDDIRVEADGNASVGVMNAGGGLGIAYSGADDPPGIGSYVDLKVDAVAKFFDPMPKILLEKSRGTQMSIQGIQREFLCRVCDEGQIRAQREGHLPDRLGGSD